MACWLEMKDGLSASFLESLFHTLRVRVHFRVADVVSQHPEVGWDQERGSARALIEKRGHQRGLTRQWHPERTTPSHGQTWSIGHTRLVSASDVIHEAD